MRCRMRPAVFLVLIGAAISGCATPPLARYVYQDNNYGVVGIPINTFAGKENFRAQAEALMARHFPEGYEIVRAEEVTEGQRTLDLGKKTEIDSEPNLTALNQMIKLGKLARTTSYEEKDMLQLRECRIIYKRKTPGTAGGPGQFSALASLSPPLYLDPNELTRRQCVEILARMGTDPKKQGEAGVQKASAQAIVPPPGPAAAQGPPGP